MSWALGSWRASTRRRHGKDEPRPALPVVDDPNLETIEIGGPNTPAQDDKLSAWARKALAFEKTPEANIIVPDQVAKPHPLVTRTRAALNNAKPSYRDERLWPDATCLDVSVGKKSIPRAIRILEALVRAVEARTWEIHTRPDTHTHGENFKTVVCVGDNDVEEVRLCLRERLKQHRFEIPERERSAWHTHRVENKPSGVLCIELYAPGAGSLRKRFKDSPTKPLEGKLGSVMAALIHHAEGARVFREVQEAREKEHQERIAGARALEKQLRSEQEKLEELTSHAAAWHRSKELRQFVGHVRTTRSPEPDSELGLYLTWAETQADRMDPLVESPASILDQKEAIEQALRQEVSWAAWGR